MLLVVQMTRTIGSLRALEPALITIRLRSMRIHASAVIAIAGLATIGCSPETDPDTDVIEAGSSFVIVETEEYEGDVEGQGIEGTLGLVDGCVGFVSHADGIVILFPPGTRVSGKDDHVVVEVRGQEFRLGDTLSGGTRLNEDARAPLTSFGDLEGDAPESCRDRDAVPVDTSG